MRKKPLKECVCDWNDWFYDRKNKCYRCKKCFGKAKQVIEQ